MPSCYIVIFVTKPNPYIMKKVFAAHKHSYGADFMIEFNTLDELKRGIVEHELYYYDIETMTDGYTDDMYTEELFKQNSKSYTLFEIELHEDERLDWSEYDGQSYFSIVKIEPKVLSTMKQVGK
jgi:hypothetical protein